MTEVIRQAIMLEEFNPDEHGPAFNDLTTLQQKFVMALVEVGLTKDFGAKAARIAGYNHDGAKQAAYRLMRNPKVLLALREEADLRMRAGALLGAMVLEEIALDPMHKDRFKAATEMMNRGGMSLIQKVEHLHQHTVEQRSDPELMAVVNRLARTLGTTPAALLGKDAVDATYTEVNDQPTDNSDSDELENLV